MLCTAKAPYLGVAYYPENWPEEEIDRDIVKMKELGINCVRVAEFAWHRMEPEPGKFDFSFFLRMADKMYAAGIAVVMGTPTATPPSWFAKKYPDAFRLNENGQRAEHGGRRHMCSNNPHYNEYCMRIVEKMAQAFKDHSAVVGWQIDNEIYSHDMGCFCPDCVARFHDRLRETYGNIDNLNRAWGLNLFSQWYDRFEDIPAPKNAWHNPHLKMAWQIFQNDSHIAFVARQADILHKYVSVPVGTDTMPFNGMDYRRMTEKMDVVQFNHYNTPKNLYYECLWFDYLRPLKERPFWNTETATTWNGSTAIGQSIKPEGFCRANSWLPLALGGEANMYWLWRTHWAGHELMHGAVLDTSGRPMHVENEVKEVSEGFEKTAAFLKDTRVSAKVGIHFTSLNWNMFLNQPLVQGFEYQKALVERIYKPLVDLGIRADVMDAVQPLDGYKVIFSPFMLTMDEANLPERMEKWVRNGGTWIVGPMSDERNHDGARYTDCLYGCLERLTGIHWKYALPDCEDRIHAEWTDGTPLHADTWFEVSEPNDAETLAKITEGHSAIRGLSVIMSKPLGKGRIILLGTLPSYGDAQKLMKTVLPEAGIALPQIAGNVMVCPRIGEKTSGVILVEYAGKTAEYTPEQTVRDLITGNTYKGKIMVEPYGVMVLESVAP